MSRDLRLVSVHAHPDDEASKGASLVAQLSSEGIGATLVCCTGGECGEILNPVMQRPDIEKNLKEVRHQELMASAKVIGYDTVDMLGYRDSGMKDDDHNAHEHNFWNADLDEATERLVKIIRRDTPQVLLTYSDDQGVYPHPDHLRTHDISVLAYERSGDANWYPDAGDPHDISKMYYVMWTKRRIIAVHEKMLALGVDSPFSEAWFDRPDHDDRVTTQIDVGAYFEARDDALRAHATQIDPQSSFWFGLTPQQLRETYPFDEYILAASRLDDSFRVDGEFETDVFAGLR